MKLNSSSDSIPKNDNRTYSSISSIHPPSKHSRAQTPSFIHNDLKISPKSQDSNELKKDFFPKQEEKKSILDSSLTEKKTEVKTNNDEICNIKIKVEKLSENLDEKNKNDRNKTKKNVKKSLVFVFDEDLEKFKEKVFDNSKFIESLTGLEPAEKLKTCLTKFNYSFALQDVQSFEEELKISDESYLKAFDPKPQLTCDPETFKKSLLNWFTFSKYPNPFRQKLIQSLFQFLPLKQTCASLQEKSFTTDLISKILSQVHLSSSQVSNPLQSKPSASKALLQKIFKFYVHQTRGTSKISTIISNENSTFLTFSKFLYFCKDFKILKPSKNPKKMSEQIQTLHDLYQKSSNFSKTMNETQFFTLLKELSEVFGNKEQGSSLEKYLKDLGIEAKDLKQKLEKFKRVEVKDSRIPENDLSKKFKLDEGKMRKMKELIKDWKGSKNKSLSIDVPAGSEENKRSCEMKITFESLKKARKEEFDLSDLIQEQSSDEEFLSHLKSKKKVNLSQSISNKILNRAQELSVLQSKIEEKKIEDVLKGSSKYFTRIFKYSKK